MLMQPWGERREDATGGVLMAGGGDLAFRDESRREAGKRATGRAERLHCDEAGRLIHLSLATIALDIRPPQKAQAAAPEQ